MKRKIEKYLSKKQGVDEAHIRYTEDGRFDFMGDLDGVLTAVRGKDGVARIRTGKSDQKPRRPSSGKKEREDPSIRGHSKSRPPPMHPSYHHPGMYMHHPYYPPMPMHSMPHGKPMDQNNKENMKPRGGPLPYRGGPPDDRRAKMFAPSPNKPEHKQDDRVGSSPFFGMSATPASTLKTPFKMDSDLSNYLASSRKNMFDSPSSSRSSSPTLDMQGMTPLTDLRKAFSSTPFNGEDDMQLFSPGTLRGGRELSKTLFSDDEQNQLDSLLKTPKPGTPKQMRFRIGDGDYKPNHNVRHVSISPISQFTSADRKETVDTVTSKSLTKAAMPEHPLSVSFADDVNDKDKMPPPSSAKDRLEEKTRGTIFFEDKVDMSCNYDPKTPIANVTHETHNESFSDDSHRDISAPSPFDTSSIIGMTPTTEKSKDGSFWSRTLDFSPAEHSFTPFKSPGVSKIKLDSLSPNDETFASSLLTMKHSGQKGTLPSAAKRRKVDATLGSPE